ncbi:MAG: acetate--CoA ligase family protein, partial [Desulfohalobiaceae bacterium]|nr:acetate--CoA ligase family protein [Desulfohalobiaceae bacterium]
IRGIKGYKLLTGFRGRARGGVEKIEKLLVSLSDMVVNHPEIMEMDLNPLLVHSQGQGATVADCRMILQEKTEESEE